MTEPAKPKLTEVAERLYRLFIGNQRSVGQFNPDSGKVHTLDRAPSVADFVTHIKGGTGVGVVPIFDDGMCSWAALDLDNHGETEDIPIMPLEVKAMALGLPVVLCRSKSGGIHVYAFFSEPLPAPRVRALLGEWAKALGHEGCEIFPKQSKLHRQASGGLSLGNWINLPYMGGRETIRYAVNAGNKIDLIEFLDLADSRKSTEKSLVKMITGQYNDCPPCISAILAGVATEGNRNEAMFNATVYLRKAYPDDFKKRAEDLNVIIFHKPLVKAELSRTVTSAGRPDYSYRCNEEPIRSHCDKAACIASKWGISPKEAEMVDLMQELPAFSDLVKYITEPVRWEVKIGGKAVYNLSTQQLLDWRIMRELITEKLMRVVPMIKAPEWERILAPILATARVVETPDDASVSGVVRLRLIEFIAKTDLTNKGQNIEDRKMLMRGLPCVQEFDGERYAVFRGQDFINYLKRTKSEELKGTNLWFAIKDLGTEYTKVRIGEQIINVWRVPVEVITSGWAEAETPVFTVDL